MCDDLIQFLTESTTHLASFGFGFAGADTMPAGFSSHTALNLALPMSVRYCTRHLSSLSSVRDLESKHM